MDKPMNKKLEWRGDELFLGGECLGTVYSDKNCSDFYMEVHHTFPTLYEARAALERMFADAPPDMPADMPPAPTERKDRIVVTGTNGLRNLIKESYFDRAIVGDDGIYLSVNGVLHGFARDSLIEGDFDRLVSWVMGA